MSRPDAVDLGVMWDRLIAIADEVLLSIVRTAFSVGVREAWDLGSVIFDVRGRAIAQGTLSMPAFIGTAPLTMGHMLARFPTAAWRPGDVVVTNDPWLGTGHTPDMCFARPVFHQDRLVGFVMTISHLPDIGGAGLSIGAREIFEEGLILPICKLYRGGEANADLLELVTLNVRTPDQVMGDLNANIAGGAVGERLIGEFMAEYGLERLDQVADGIIGQSGAAIRARIGAMADGCYRHEIQVETVAEPVTLRCAVTVAGERLGLDFAGTGPCQPAAINVPQCYTRAFAAYAVKCLTVPELPNNQGVVDAIEIRVPEGSILDARRPAPTGGRHVVGWFVVPLILGALAEAVPDRVQAESGMATLLLVQGTHPDGQAIATQYFLAGGLGAMAGLDGHQTTPAPTNNAVVASEVWENETAMTVLGRRLRPDSGGPGRYRGGVGQIAALRNDSGHPLTVALFGMRTEVPAQGLFGGRPGARRRFLINGRSVAAKSRHVLAPGDVLEIHEAGGGGTGDPLTRPVADVARDVAAGMITREGAKADYGVDIDPVTGQGERDTD